MKKTIFSSFLVLLLVFGHTILPKAESENEQVLDQMTTADFEFIEAEEAKKEKVTLAESEQIQSIMENNGLQTINEDEIPADTLVMNFDSVEEFEKFLEETQEPLELAIDDTKHNSLLEIFQPQTVDAASRLFSHSQRHGSSKLNLYVEATKGSNGLISKTRVWTSHTGITVGFHWKQNAAYATLSSTKKSGTAYGHGTFSWVIFVKSIGTLYSRDVTMTKTFHVDHIK